MNDFVEEAPELKRKMVVQLADVNEQKFDYNKDHTPVKISGVHIIQDDKIRIEFSDRNPPSGKESPSPRMPQSPMQTFENMGNIATDRKFAESINGGSSPVLKQEPTKFAKNIEVILMDDEPQQPTSPEPPFKQLSRPQQKCLKVVLYIASMMSFFIFSMDILYVLQAPFYQNWMMSILCLLFIRYFFCLLACVWWIQCSGNKFSKQASVEFIQSAQVTEALKDFFQNIGGIPILITLGLYRVLSPDQNAVEINIGYGIEFTTSLLPMLVFQIMNNSVHTGQMTWLQTSLLTLRFLSLTFFIFELVVILCYRRCKFIIRSQDRRKLTPDQVNQYQSKIAQFSCFGLIGLITIIILGTMALPSRKCKEMGQVLSWGVCVPCEADNCIDCWSGPKECSTCADGYHADKLSGECKPCSEGCELCVPNKHDSSMNECLQCGNGYKYDKINKNCHSCDELTGMHFCKSCEQDKCTECIDGFFFQDMGGGKKQCVKCDAKYEFCDECSDSKCLRCKDHVATFDENGECKVCSEPWMSLNGQWPNCFCPYIVDVKDNYLCKECSQLIPGCNKCEYSKEYMPSKTSVMIGWDDVLSAQGMNQIQTNREDKPEWIVCTEGDNVHAINYATDDTESKENLIQEVEVHLCNQLIPGCSSCHKRNSTIQCNKCSSSNRLVVADERQHRDHSIKVKNECIACSLYDTHCQECDNMRCRQCDDTFRTYYWSKKCHKCYYEWMCEEPEFMDKGDQS